MSVTDAAKLFPEAGGIVIGEGYRVDRDSVAAVSRRTALRLDQSPHRTAWWCLTIRRRAQHRVSAFGLQHLHVQQLDVSGIGHGDAKSLQSCSFTTVLDDFIVRAFSLQGRIHVAAGGFAPKSRFGLLLHCAGSG
jgi:hypothetical protein